MFDVVQTVHLGLTSAIFLIVGLGMLFLKNEIPFSKPLAGAAISMLIILARSKLVFGNIDIWAVIASGLITFFVLSFMRLSKSDKLEI